MRKLLGTFTLILISTVAAFSQDLGPLQVGYAVVTASGTGSMSVFETFGLRRTAETTQATVIPEPLTTNAVLFVRSSGRLSRNLGVAMVNPNSTSVSVNLVLRREDGTQSSNTVVTLAAKEHSSRFITELFSGQQLLSEVQGTIAITSSMPISVVGLRFRGINFSTMPVNNLGTPGAVPVISAGVGGANSVLLPQFVSGGGWVSQIVVGNNGTTSLSVRVDLFKEDGTHLSAQLNGTTASTFNLTIPGGGVATLAPRNSLGDDDF
jgi:hypothetical protein